MGQHSSEITERTKAFRDESPPTDIIDTDTESPLDSDFPISVTTEGKEVQTAPAKRHFMLNPKKRSLIERYFTIYSDYVRFNHTEKELAEKYGYRARAHISLIIQWCAHQLNIKDNNTYIQTISDSVDIDIREIRARCIKENEAGGLDVRKDLAMRSELRRLQKLKAQLRGILHEGVVVDMGDHRSLHVLTAPGFARRIGATSTQGEATA